MNQKKTLCPNKNCLSTTYKKKIKGNLVNKAMYKALDLVQCQVCGLDHKKEKRIKYTITEFNKRTLKEK